MRLTLPAAAMLAAVATGLATAPAVPALPAEATTSEYPADLATAWASVPVYVDPTQDGILTADDADRLAADGAGGAASAAARAGGRRRAPAAAAASDRADGHTLTSNDHVQHDFSCPTRQAFVMEHEKSWWCR